MFWTLQKQDAWQGSIGFLDEVQKEYSEKVRAQQKPKFFASEFISENWVWLSYWHFSLWFLNKGQPLEII